MAEILRWLLLSVCAYPEAKLSFGFIPQNKSNSTMCLWVIPALLKISRGNEAIISHITQKNLIKVNLHCLSPHSLLLSVHQKILSIFLTFQFSLWLEFFSYQKDTQASGQQYPCQTTAIPTAIKKHINN